ncbi:hypothetical protein UPYG_G00078670 [Umbra pygmaea]|uniref:Uncharacterized protein n=1 Tax=Umbra pygmaea TaxID=75934 RepID=A0ABD0XD94_UMBPY
MKTENADYNMKNESVFPLEAGSSTVLSICVQVLVPLTAVLLHCGLTYFSLRHM